MVQKQKINPKSKNFLRSYIFFSDNLKVKEHLIELFSSNRTLDTKNNHFGGYDN